MLVLIQTALAILGYVGVRLLSWRALRQSAH
jgi:hypothetical protein